MKNIFSYFNNIVTCSNTNKNMFVISVITGYNSKYFPLTATNKYLLLAVTDIFYTFAASNNLIQS